MTQPESPPNVPTESRELVRAFVEHWGGMARAWGINTTMGELFALLYITGTDWTAEDLRLHLRVSRGNVSMNLRELMNWGVVHKMHRHGERREFFRAEADVWTLFRRIVTERKRRELEPTLGLLEGTVRQVAQQPELGPMHHRVLALHKFFASIDGLVTRLIELEPRDLAELLAVFETGRDDEEAARG